MCNCREGKGWTYMNKRHRAIVDAVATAVRKGYKGVHIYDDERIKEICAAIPDDEGGLKRPDLICESFITKRGKTKKIFNMTEITIPWAWGDSLERAYDKKARKYAPVQVPTREYRIPRSPSKHHCCLSI
jgi:hypothetical protein